MGAYKDKNGTWYAQFRFTNWKGEPDRKTKRGFATKREALDWERDFLTQSSGNLEMTFEAFYELYKKNMKERIKLSTWNMKESVIEGKILPYFKRKRMCDIKPRDVVEWQNTLIKNGTENGEPYSPVYLKTIHNQLSAIFNHAVKFYDLPSNPNRTKIIIAQRIASVRRADRIVVLENGSITSCGTHEELMECCKTYRDIYDSQMGEDGENHG